MSLRRQIRLHLDSERLFGSDLLPVSGGLPPAAPRRVPVHPAPAARLPAELPPPEWTSLRNEVLRCTRCGLCEQRTQAVFGTGSIRAPVLFVGEGPGEEEDRRGEPFVGRAGQLLTKTLAKFGVDRSQVYIANIVKCRPPGNRQPRPEEMLACMPYLQKQIRWIHPQAVCALGGVAATTLLNTKTGITRLRGRYHDIEGLRLVPTFHPAYILRNMGELAVFESDIQRVLRDAGLPGPAPPKRD
jgi:DNA polymerase